jgi:hypothetical protein
MAAAMANSSSMDFTEPAGSLFNSDIGFSERCRKMAHHG